MDGGSISWHQKKCATYGVQMKVCDDIVSIKVCTRQCMKIESTALVRERKKHVMRTESADTELE